MILVLLLLSSVITVACSDILSIEDYSILDNVNAANEQEKEYDDESFIDDGLRFRQEAEDNESFRNEDTIEDDDVNLQTHAAIRSANTDDDCDPRHSERLDYFDYHSLRERNKASNHQKNLYLCILIPIILLFFKQIY